MTSASAPGARLVDGALLAALLLALAFQDVRFEGYETHKAALLAILAGAALAGLLPKLGLRRRIRLTPLGVAALLWLAAWIVATAFSLSQSRSFWGTASRAGGLLTLILHLILFAGAQGMGRRARGMILPALFLAAIPVALFTIAGGILAPESRPGSTGGNANFTAAWMAYAAIFCTPIFLQAWRRMPSAPRLARTLTFGLFAAWAGLLIVAILFSGTRGALLGILAAGGMAGIAVAALTRKRRVMAALLIGVALAIIPYGLVNSQIDTDQYMNTSVLRVFTFTDSGRLKLWEAADMLFAGMDTPLRSLWRAPDPFAGLRWWIGHGPEVTEHLQYKVLALYGQINYVDAFHNVSLDALVNTGVCGLLAVWGIYHTAFYTALRALGLVRSARRFALAVIAGATLGGAGALIGLQTLAVGARLALGAGAGSLVGILLLVGSSAFDKRNAPPGLALLGTRLDVLAILGVLCADWVIMQFSFTQNMTQPLLWILLGVLAGRAQSVSAGTDDSFPVPDVRAWLAALAGVGLFTLHGFGVAIDTPLRQIATLPDVFPLFLAVTAAAGLCMAVCLPREGWPRRRMITVCLSIGALWISFFVLKGALAAEAGSRFTAAFSEYGVAGELLQQSGYLQAISGALAALIVIGLGVWGAAGRTSARDARSSLLRAVPVGLLAVVLCGLGLRHYLPNFASASLHGYAIVLSNSWIPEELAASEAVYTAAGELSPQNTRLIFHHLENLTRMVILAPDAESAHILDAYRVRRIAALFGAEPFFNNGLEWIYYQRRYYPGPPE